MVGTLNSRSALENFPFSSSKFFGITWPKSALLIELAIFSIKYNDLKAKVQLLKTNKNRDIGIFEYFYETKFENYYLPKVYVPRVFLDKNKEAYNVIASRLNYKSMLFDTEIVKGDYCPKFGFNTRYTVYDIDENENEYLNKNYNSEQS